MKKKLFPIVFLVVLLSAVVYSVITLPRMEKCTWAGKEAFCRKSDNGKIVTFYPVNREGLYVSLGKPIALPTGEAAKLHRGGEK
jgi:hypothetical protein